MEVNELGPVQLKVAPDVAEVALSCAVESAHVMVSPMAVTPGCAVSWLTTISAKQLSDELNGFVIEKRYVPPCVIRRESKPLMVSLMPAPSCTLFLVHINIGLGKSLL